MTNATKKAARTESKAIDEAKTMASLRVKLKAADPEIQNYVAALEAENLKLHRNIGKLQAENVSLNNRIKVFVEENPNEHHETPPFSDLERANRLRLLLEQAQRRKAEEDKKG
jgi:hypothetical protein